MNPTLCGSRGQLLPGTVGPLCEGRRSIVVLLVGSVSPSPRVCKGVMLRGGRGGNSGNVSGVPTQVQLLVDLGVPWELAVPTPASLL